MILKTIAVTRLNRNLSNPVAGAITGAITGAIITAPLPRRHRPMPMS